MRILFTYSGGLGHLEPLVPIARAAQAVGHVVAFVGRPWMVPKAAALGFESLAAGFDAGLVPERRPLVPVDLEREAGDLRDGFVTWIGSARAKALVAIVEDWRPDVVVWDETDFGAPVAAERVGLPHAPVITLAAGTYVRPATFAGTLDSLRAEHGLAPDPDLAMLRRHLVIAPVPPSYRDPDDPLPPQTLFIRPQVRVPGALEPVPA